MLNGNSNNCVALSDLLTMAKKGRQKVRDGEIKATFDLNGAAVTLALISQSDLANIIAGSGMNSMAGLIEQFSKKIKKDDLKLEERKDLLDEFRQTIENPMASRDDNLARALAPYVVSIAEQSISDDETPYVSLGWIIRLGIILADYQTDMADMKVQFDQKLAEQLLIGSRIFSNWVTEKIADVERFYSAVHEEELGNSPRSLPGTPITGSKDAAPAATQNLKSSGANTPSSATSTEIPPTESSKEEPENS